MPKTKIKAQKISTSLFNSAASSYAASVEAMRSNVREILACHPESLTPCIIFDLNRLDEQIDLWGQELPGIQPHYAIKACDARGILEHMRVRDLAFDAATGGELELLHQLKIDCSRIVMTHPIRTDYDLCAMRKCRPHAIVVESDEEVIKLAQAGIPSEDYSPVLLVRVGLPFSNLNKFGVHCITQGVGDDGKPTSIVDYRPVERIFLKALSLEREMSTKYAAFGLAGHVGTNTTSVRKYQRLLSTFNALGQELRRNANISITFFDIGGGYCDQMQAQATGITQQQLLQEISVALTKFRKNYYQPVKIIAEPGRFFVADTAVAVCRCKSVSDAYVRVVSGVEIHEQHKVVHLDDGVYGSLMGQIHDGRRYRPIPIRVGAPEPDGLPMPVVMWGPTCDSFDRIITPDDYRVPEDLATNDFCMIECMGAYSAVTATEFNRTSKTKVVYFRRDQPSGRLEYKLESTLEGDGRAYGISQPSV